MTYIPRHNAPLEHKEWVEWVQKELLALRRENERLAVNQGAAGRAGAVGASQAASTTVRVETHRLEIGELQGRDWLPPDGSVGETVTIFDDGKPGWTSVTFAVTPEYWVYLEDGNPSWSVNNSGGLPVPVIEDDGKWLHPIEDSTGTFEAPVIIHVSVTPHSTDEAFGVYRPSWESSTFSVEAYTISIQNDGAFRAVVQLDEHLFYSGTNVRVPELLSLEPGEMVLWRVQAGASGTYECNVTPFALEAGIGYTDRYFTRFVAALRGGESWSAVGDLEVAVGEVAHTNSSTEAKIIGKIAATLTTAPTGSGVEVMVYLNGTPILSTPLVVAAGTTYAEAVPDAATTSITVGSYSFPVLVFDPGDQLTVEIVSVGSTTPGSGIVVRALYG